MKRILFLSIFLCGCAQASNGALQNLSRALQQVVADQHNLGDWSDLDQKVLSGTGDFSEIRSKAAVMGLAAESEIEYQEVYSNLDKNTQDLLDEMIKNNSAVKKYFVKHVAMMIPDYITQLQVYTGDNNDTMYQVMSVDEIDDFFDKVLEEELD